MKKTLGDYLIETYGENAIDLYWSEKNTLSPYDYTYQSGKEVWMRCDKTNYHKDYIVKCSQIARGCGCPYCSKKRLDVKDSFGHFIENRFGKDYLNKIWSKKNEESPYDYFYSSSKYVWINCIEKDYHGEYITRISRFIAGHRCPYCVGQKTHPKDSFAQWGIDNICEDFLEKYWSDKNTVDPYTISKKSTKKIFIKCQEKQYHEDYCAMTNEFVIGNRCPYCASKKIHILDSLGSKYPESVELYSDKNKKSIYEIPPFTPYKAYWKCENGIHEDYQRTVSKNTILGFRCPECSKINRESSLEKSIKDFLTENNYEYSCEYGCSITPKNPKNKHGLPFDIEVKELKLIIEAHGGQHYNLLPKDNSWTGGLTPEQYLHKRKLYDRYKRLIAHINKYEYLEIPYWEFDDDTYKQTILDKIESIRIKGE